jgi:CubicO group peptidase (beta-lactamase class C family)
LRKGDRWTAQVTNMKRRTFLFTSAVAGMVAVGDRINGSERPKRQKLELDSLLEVTQVPGIAVAGVLDGRLFQRFAGVRASSGHEPITANTYVPAASLSKPVFAWAVRDLVKQGKLEWDKPLEDYARLGLSGDAKRITAEHVLTHTTGLPNWRFKPGQDLVAAFTPGSKWRYSGEGIFLLHRVVEKIVGVPIASYMKDNVLSPLGMTASTFAWTPEIQATATSGHDRRGLPLEPSPAFYARQSYDAVQQAGLRAESASIEQILAAYERAKLPALPVNIAPNMAGSLWTTAEDYPKFLKRVLKDTSERPDDYRPRIDVNRAIAWSLGWAVDRSLGAPSFFHTGDAPGFKNLAWVQPAKKTALVFFTNGDNGVALYAWMMRNLLSEDPACLYWI